MPNRTEVSSGKQRQIQRLRERGRKYVVHKGHVFTQANGVVAALSAACHGLELRREDCAHLLRQLGGLLVLWTDGFRADNKAGEWYSVICRRCLAVEELPKKKRYTLKRSMEQCTVRRLGAEELAETGYHVYVQALRRYRTHSKEILSSDEFYYNVAREKEYPDLIHNWGVYYNDQLIGYAQNEVFGIEEVNYSSMKFDPQFFHVFPGYALVYSMNRYYLEECGYWYVNDGFRCVVHDTNIQAFLIETFGFEKAYTTVHLHYRPLLRCVIAMMYPLRGVVGRISRRLGALLEQERCHRLSC